MKNAHEFAIYIDQLSSLITSVAAGGQLAIDDEETYHRITKVLRLRIDDQCVLFDEKMHGIFLIKEFQTKRRVVGTLISKNTNQIFKPHITFMLPILKRENLDDSIYSLVEIGANVIQLVITEKAQRAWRGEKEFDRLQRVMIAAAEQSKNFALPELLPPITFNEMIQVIKKRAVSAIFFDAQGRSLNQIISIEQEKNPKEIILMVGPEGDLVASEKKLLQENNVLFAKLTPTILRASQAVSLSIGIFRSLF